MDLIKLEAVDFEYPDGTRALSGVDLFVKAGERVAVLGANGAGKSTLFQLFNGLLEPSRGKVSVKGSAVEKKEKKRLKEVRRMIGMVFQDPDDQLFSGTVRQEVAYGPSNLGLAGRDMEKAVAWALEVVGLSGYENKSPINLSGGEKKRVALASVLAMRPEVLVLDEPTAALDPLGAAKIVKLLNGINRQLGITLVFATHDVDVVPLLADRVYVMDRGRIRVSGTTAKVFAGKELLRSCNLRLPRVAHLAEIMERDGKNCRLPSLPLTIGQARKIFSLSERPEKKPASPEDLPSSMRDGKLETIK